MENIKDECCPEFNPVPWDEKIHIWDNKRFVRDTTRQFLHIPLPGTISGMIKRQMKMIEESEASPHTEDFIWLSYDPSPWKSEHFFHVIKEVNGADNVFISGTFMTKVFDGPYRSVPSWIKEMNIYVETNGYKALKYYVYYTTCPRCAKKYGHNYVVLFAMI